MPRGATPSRWCVCQFHHFGCLIKAYLLDFSSAGAGAASLFSVPAGLGAGAASFCSAAGGGVAGAGVAFAGTTDRLDGLLDMIVSAREVTMKMTAAAVVAFESSVAAPRWPNVV